MHTPSIVGLTMDDSGPSSGGFEISVEPTSSNCSYNKILYFSVEGTWLMMALPKETQGGDGVMS